MSELIADLVGLAKELVEDFDIPVTVAHRAYTGQDNKRKPTYAAPVNRQAIWQDDVRSVRDADGNEVLTQARVSFLENVTIGARDVLEWSGRSGPVLSIQGLAAPEGGKYFATVFIGAQGATTA
jgi:hypothetical protein